MSLLSKINAAICASDTGKRVLFPHALSNSFIQKTSMRYFFAFLLLPLLSCANKKKTTGDELADKMYTALVNSRTEDAMQLVQQLYEKSGVQFGQVEWVYKEPTEVYNYYHSFGPRIILGRMPQPGKETQEYWINWRKVLTNDGWDPQQFFKDENEMLLMANYNIVVLIAHELGHYFEDYYDTDVPMPKDNVNGRELYADRFSIALTNELAKSDPRFASMKQRYLELVQSMNATVPESHRYTPAQGKILVAYPDSVMVAQPSFDDPKTMQPYASAFFQRHRVLLSGEIALPPLQQLADSILWKKHYEKIAAMPYLVSRFDTAHKGKWEGGHFQTVEEILFQKGFAATDERYGAHEIYFADTFSILRMDTRGRTWNVSIQAKEIVKSKFTVRMVYQCTGSPEEELPGEWNTQYRQFPEHLFIRSDTDFIVVISVMDGKTFYRALHYQKNNGKWTMNEVQLTRDHPIFTGAYDEHAVTSCVSEDGRFIILVKKFIADGHPYKMDWYELDKTSLQPGAAHSIGTTPGHAYPAGMSMAADGRIYIASGYYITTYKDGKWNTLFGNGIAGDALSADPFHIACYDAGVMAATGRSLVYIGNWGGKRYVSKGDILEVKW
jgi:hypothetical protein